MIKKHPLYKLIRRINYVRQRRAKLLQAVKKLVYPIINFELTPINVNNMPSGKLLYFDNNKNII